MSVTDRGGPEVEAVLWLPRLARSAGAARGFIEDFCRSLDLTSEVTDTAVLLVSELVTNALIHGRTSARMEVRRGQGVLRIAIQDANPGSPPVRERPDVTSEHGRGLMIVSLLADRWGVEVTDDAKAIWFELYLRPRPSADSARPPAPRTDEG